MRIKEEGVYFQSHIDGKRIFMGPEESMQIQSNLASTIAMAFDECIENPSPFDYVKASCARTVRWLERCQKKMAQLNADPNTINQHQLLFGINQVVCNGEPSGKLFLCLEQMANIRSGEVLADRAAKKRIVQ